jgi:hypothetical protein
MKEKTWFIKSFIIILFTGVLISSCKKDEDDGDSQDDLIGTWITGLSTIDAKVGDIPMNQFFIDSLGLSASDAQVYTSLFNITVQQSYAGTVTFNANGTYSATFGGDTDTGTWVFSSDNKQLTIDSNLDPPLELDVVRLTANELVLSWNETVSEDINEDGIPEVISVDVEMTLTK